MLQPALGYRGMVFSGLPLVVLVVIFAAAAGAVWVAGVRLAELTDILSTRLGLGQALGGAVLLAIVTNLPEVAITTTAALSNHLDVAIGNLLGGVAIQTVVLVVLDVFGSRGARPLTYQAASVGLILEGALVVAVLIVAVGGSRLPKGAAPFGLEPAALLIVILWVAGLYLVNRASTSLPWHEGGQPPDGQDPPKGHASKQRASSRQHQSTARLAVLFALGAAVTMAGGYVLEESGARAAAHVGLSGVLFGATALAAATALPDVSTGMASLRLGDAQLAFSDILGANAFLPVLILLASVLSGEAVLSQAHATDIYLTALGALLTVVYITGLIFRPPNRIARMGPDSLAVLTLYTLGTVGLVFVAQTHG